jgi:hypothetical protein
MPRKLLLVPAVVVTLLVPTIDANAAPHPKKNWKQSECLPPGLERVAEHKPAGGGDGRRMR